MGVDPEPAHLDGSDPHGELARRLAALADGARLPGVPGRSALVRRRARAVRQRRAAVAAVVVLGCAAPLPRLVHPHPAPDRLSVAAGSPERTVATFTFPDVSATTELTVPASAAAGEPVRVVVRVTSRRGRVAGVDLTWGDGRAAYLDGGARCTPDAGPTVVALTATHTYAGPGSFSVRAAPQVLTGCRAGLAQTSVRGAAPAVEVVRVGTP